MANRTGLLDALTTITAERRAYQQTLDAERAARLADVAPQSSDEPIQALGALVRQLDNAARELTDAIKTTDQYARLNVS